MESARFYEYGMDHMRADIVDHSESTIPVYVINLPSRADRLAHIKGQFDGRGEFDVTYVEGCEHDVGAVGLWRSIRKVIQLGIDNEDDVLIICEDDHEFTAYYSFDVLIRNILEAHVQGVDILSGGTSGGFGHALPVALDRFWVNHFLSTQFIVVYRKFFQRILNAPFGDSVTADNFLSELTCNKMVIYPFISVQKNFGYSDVTPIHNAAVGLVSSMFRSASDRLLKIRMAHNKFHDA